MLTSCEKALSVKLLTALSSNLEVVKAYLSKPGGNLVKENSFSEETEK